MAESPQPPPHPAALGRTGHPGDKTKELLLAPPTVSLPKGGGAIAGIGEKFAADPVTGTAGFSIPVAASPGRGGFGPKLSLAYDSGAGNGPFGLGWRLGVPSIRRRTQKALPRYRDAEDSDVFVLSDAEDLVPLQKQVGGSWVDDVRIAGDFSVRRYRPRIESAFTRIERWTDTASGDAHWRTLSRDNVTRIYGQSASARLADPDDPSRVFEWLLEEARDELGHVVSYVYKAEDGANVALSEPAEARRHCAYTYLKRIRYGNSTPFVAGDWKFEVVFDYGEHDPDDPTPEEATPWPVRADPHSAFRAGFDVRCYRLCRRVLMFHAFAELGSEPLLVRSTELAYAEDPKITTLTTVTGRGWQRVDGAWTTATTPPLELAYSAQQIDETVRFVEGLDDLPGSIDPRRMQWVDLDGEGLTGLLTEQASAWYYKRSLGGGQLARLQRLGRRPALDLSQAAGNRLMDLDGDGRLEVVHLDGHRGGPAGYQARSDDGWEPFRRFESVPNLDWNDPNLRFVDLDGDGRPDVLLTEDAVLRWYPNVPGRGFEAARSVWKAADEDDGPRVVFASRAETILLADMTGDGLSDLVRVRNRQVCYWPNRGYGKFGAKVLMKGAPSFDAPDRYDAARLRVADIDGSGTTDLLYLGPDGVRLWFNQAGNSWSDEVALARFPSVAKPNTIQVADLLGDGTACLVWSSPLLGQSWAPLRYMRLMGQGKPHLLTKVVNDLGRETRLTYTPSTASYVADRAAGRPWATRLPFPVQCLSQVETVDAVTGWKFVQTYAYHHGYYDGVEREFRGFGLVEQRDTQSFSDFEDPTKQNSDIVHYLPPVLTRTWFHTGAWRKESTLQQAFATEYWSGDASAGAPRSTVFPAGLSPREAREAHRALKGRVLRQEVFAEDGSPGAGNPYTVAESSYTVRPIQPAGEDAFAYAAYLVVPRESVTRHYERNPDDPRVQHALTLQVDEYGHVTRSAAIGYPRRTVPSGLEPQGELHVVVTETSYLTDDAADDRLHLGLAWDKHTWELTGVSYAEGRPPSPEDVDADIDAATAIAYEATPTGGSTKEKRRLGRDRTLYQADDLSGPLAAGTMGVRALVYEHYRLAYTTGLLSSVYGTRVDARMLQDEGGYVDLLSDGDQWLRSGRATLDPNHFYHPVDDTDAFGNVTAVTWDAHDLFVVSVEALKVNGATAATGLTTTADIDYRVLKPYRVTGPNGTKHEGAFDPLGRLVKTAVIGPNGEGDTLSAPTTESAYTTDRWQTQGLPNRVHVKAREHHGGSTLQERYAYSDGGGHVVMTKVQAAPGDAPTVVNGTLSWAPADPRWVGTGRTEVDNKGHVVKQYEPFFSTTEAFEDEDVLVQWGVTPVMIYDPLGRLVRADLPNGTFRTVTFDPWQSVTSDENDTVLESTWYSDRMALSSSDPEYRAAQLAAAHANTPETVYFDAIGRPFRTDEAPDGQTTCTTVVTLDVQGNPKVLTDARGIDTQTQAFDLLGRAMYTNSPDAGETWVLLDEAGKPCRTWRSGDLALQRTYDAMRRPVHLFVTEGAPGSQITHLVEKAVYGEVLAMQAALDGFLLGRVYRVYDTAGCVTHDAFGFEGHLLQHDRRFLSDVDADPDWSTAANDTDPDAIETAVGSLLSAETFTTSDTWDALGRVVTHTTPDASVATYGYDAGGRLTTVSVAVRGTSTATDFVTAITYDPKGQREQIRYGNGTDTAYTYDPDTFRLKTLVTTRDSDSARVQDLTYTYDPVGNIVQISDDSQQTLFFNNTVISPTQQYTYDALYRLTQAQGRQNGALTQPDYSDPSYGDLPHGNDSTTIRNYTQRYAYDGVGNIQQMRQSGVWTRYYAYATDSNRLLTTSVPGDDPNGPYSDAYGYNDRGAMTSMPHLSALGRDFRDQVRTVDLGNGDDAVYHYDASGQRVRKVVRRSQNTEERVYLGGYEVYRKSVSGNLDTERQTLHVMDDQRRIAMVEMLTVDGGSTVSSPPPRQRYQLDNHLGTACVEVDDTGALITYEEYFPYGSTSWRASASASEVSAKRYRYTGKEKDEETGLYYNGTRYYACWLGRWCSADPIGVKGGINRYAYVEGRPIIANDPTGHLLLLLWFLKGSTSTEKPKPLPKPKPPFSESHPLPPPAAQGPEIHSADTPPSPGQVEAWRESQRQNAYFQRYLSVRGGLFAQAAATGAVRHGDTPEQVAAAGSLGAAATWTLGTGVAPFAEIPSEEVETAHGVRLEPAGRRLAVPTKSPKSTDAAGGTVHNVEPPSDAPGFRLTVPPLVVVTPDAVPETTAPDADASKGALNVSGIAKNPASLWGRSADEIAQGLNDAGFSATVRQSTRGSGRAQIISVEGHPEITQIQVHPGGGRHGGSYIKVSTSTEGKIKVIDPETYVADPNEVVRTIPYNEGG